MNTKVQSILNEIQSLTPGELNRLSDTLNQKTRSDEVSGNIYLDANKDWFHDIAEILRTVGSALEGYKHGSILYDVNEDTGVILIKEKDLNGNMHSKARLEVVYNNGKKYHFTKKYFGDIAGEDRDEFTVDSLESLLKNMRLSYKLPIQESILIEEPVVYTSTLDNKNKIHLLDVLFDKVYAEVNNWDEEVSVTKDKTNYTVMIYLVEGTKSISIKIDTPITPDITGLFYVVSIMDTSNDTSRDVGRFRTMELAIQAISTAKYGWRVK